MPVKDYRAYAESPKGKAARAKSHARYIVKRREGSVPRQQFDAQPLALAINQWRTS